MFIAITGTIGSGKSTVTEVLRSMGKNCLSCDEINQQLLKEPEYIALIGKRFPEAVKDGRVDKRKLSAIVFQDENSRADLNALAHPRIFEKIHDIASKMLGDVFVEVPLISEVQNKNLFDRIWEVKSNKRIQIERVALRDGKTTEEAEQIYNLQSKNHDKNLATDTIYNRSSKDDLIAQIEVLLKKRNG